VRRFQWTEQAKGELRKIEREQAMKILLELTRYGNIGQGDVKRLQDSDQYRLRVGDYRVRFKVLDDGTLRVVHVRHRKDAYRD
jgi:mRNA-degrading endonuclease RelE of RelBE toxin-antitoxin system